MLKAGTSNTSCSPDPGFSLSSAHIDLCGRGCLQQVPEVDPPVLEVDEVVLEVDHPVLEVDAVVLEVDEVLGD